MAGDWTPCTKNLDQKPEFGIMLRLTGLTVEQLHYALLKFWSWADDHSEDGFFPGMTVADVSAICPHLVRSMSADCPAFLHAMSHVGWLAVNTDGVAVPHFDYWMGNSAKRRLKDSMRKRKNRTKPNTDTQPVRKLSAPRPHPVLNLADKSGTTVQDSTVQSKKLPSEACPETLHVSGPPVLTFPTDGKIKEWGLTEDYLAEMRDAYPSVDVLAECRKALAWVNANPSRRKTARGMKSFLLAWMGRCQDRSGGPARPAPTGKPTMEDMVKKAMEGA